MSSDMSLWLVQIQWSGLEIDVSPLVFLDGPVLTSLYLSIVRFVVIRLICLFDDVCE